MRAAVVLAFLSALLVAAPAQALDCNITDVNACKGLGGCFPGDCIVDTTELSTTGYVCKEVPQLLNCINNPAQGDDPAPPASDLCQRSMCLFNVTNPLETRTRCVTVPRPDCLLCKSVNVTTIPGKVCPKKLCATSICTTHLPRQLGRCDFGNLDPKCCSPLACKASGGVCFPRKCVFSVPGPPFKTNFPAGQCIDLPRPVPTPPGCCYDDECAATGTFCKPMRCGTGRNAGKCIAAPPPYVNCCEASSDCPDVDFDACTLETCKFPVDPVTNVTSTNGLCVPGPHPKGCCQPASLLADCPADPLVNNCNKRICNLKLRFTDPNYPTLPVDVGTCQYLDGLNGTVQTPAKRDCKRCSLPDTAGKCVTRDPCKVGRCAGPFTPIPYTCTVAPNPAANGAKCAVGKICKNGACVLRPVAI